MSTNNIVPAPPTKQPIVDKSGLCEAVWWKWFSRLQLELVKLLPPLGTANQIIGVNAAATANENKTLNGTANQTAYAHAANSITLSLAGPHNFATQTLRGVLLGQGTSPVTATAAMTDGQLLVGQTSGDPLPKSITGDWALSAAGAATLATVNAGVGSFGSTTQVAAITVNGKGLITAAANSAIAFPVTSVFGQTGAISNLSGDVTTSGSSATTVAKIQSTTVSGTTGTGNVVFSATPTFTGTLNCAALTPTGLIDISGASAGQIKFPATQNPSSNANALDDYEEGTWTPGISFGGGTTGITYAAQVGVYTKVGNTVNLGIRVVLSSKGSSTGQSLVTGLPFTQANTTNGFYGFMAGGSSFGAAVNSLQSAQNPNTTTLFVQSIAAGVVLLLTQADFNNDSALNMNGSIFT